MLEGYSQSIAQGSLLVVFREHVVELKPGLQHTKYVLQPFELFPSPLLLTFQFGFESVQ